MYNQPGKLIKKSVELTNLVGYAISDIIGLAAGIMVGLLLRRLTDMVLIWVLGGLAAAGGVALICCQIVWLAGLMVYGFGDTVDSAEQIKCMIANGDC